MDILHYSFNEPPVTKNLQVFLFDCDGKPYTIFGQSYALKPRGRLTLGIVSL